MSRFALSAADRACMVDLYVRQGLAVITIARRFGCNRGTVSNALKRAGVKVEQTRGLQVSGGDGKRYPKQGARS